MSRHTFIAAWLLLAIAPAFAQDMPPDEARAIAKEAYIYGFPMLKSYRIQYSYFVDKNDKEYKGAWNEIHDSASGSVLGADLRAEPLVITVPKADRGHSYPVQFIDMYTFEFDSLGTKASGSEAGTFLLAGPGWKGEKPAGIKRAIRSETDFAFVVFRAKAGYKVQRLSAFLGKPATPPAPALEFPPPSPPDKEHRSPRNFDLLNFILRFCPPQPSEAALRARFEKIGIVPGKPLDPKMMAQRYRQALKSGIADAWTAFAEYKATELDTGKVPMAARYGTRAAMKAANGDRLYLARMASAEIGIYENALPIVTGPKVLLFSVPVASDDLGVT